MPELDHLSPREKKHILRSSVKRGSLVWLWAQAIVVGGFLGGIAGTLVYVAGSWLPGITPGTMPGGVGVLLLWVLPVMLGVVIWFQMQMHRIRKAMRQAIVEFVGADRLPVCLQCGYDARAMAIDRCPECNAALRPG